MGDYPDSDEEFELMYGDELQMLGNREDEEIDVPVAGPTSRKSLDFTTPTSKVKSQVAKTKTVESQPSTSKQADILENSFDRDFRKLEDNDINSKKRNLDALFGDIDDLLLEEERNKLRNSKKPKKEGEKEKENLELIERIIQMRQLAADKLNPNLSVDSSRAMSSYEHVRNNVSSHVPKYPFIALTNHNDVRIYVRMHNEEYEKDDIKRITNNNSYKGLLGNQSKKLWETANQIINQHLEEETTVQDEQMEVEETDNSKLWVDFYKPRKYTELLSDESTNRTLLKWLKLWDKVVFHRRPRVRSGHKHPPPKFNNFNNRFLKKDLDITLDEHDRPKNKVALLCGPPGLGKTTLAHMVAKHAGYNVVEINASDDRNVESFKTALENSTQMKSVIDKEGRPNCLVFDEIDGAPSAAIDFLIKFINGTSGKAKKGKKAKPSILKRPIICICNDVYVPALRPLRQIAFILNFPPTAPIRLAERLMEIARHQQIKTDVGSMISLSEKSNNDIRSCLSVLNFFKTKNKPVTLSEVAKTNIGLKDVQKGLFTVWNDIFEIKRLNGGKDDSPMNERMKFVLDTVTAFGDYERLTQGVFENYPAFKHKGTPFEPVCTAMEWFSYTDCISKKIHQTQNYTLSTYLPYGFVVWHFTFATSVKQRIAYPSVGYEVTTKTAKQTAIISEILRGIPPQLRSYVSASSLRLDTLPMFADILVPILRTINVSLYAPQEKSQIANVVDIMIDYNLTYVQERNADGAYVFQMDPNIEEVNTYQGLKTYRRGLSYTSKQMLAREIDLEKMRRLERSIHRNSGTEKQQEDKGKQNNEEKKVEEMKKDTEKKKEKENADANKPPALPNHLQRLKAKTVKPKEVIVKDFFGRVITKPAKPKFGEPSGQSFAGDIWFQFKEGYSNAVRRRVKMSKLLRD